MPSLSRRGFLTATVATVLAGCVDPSEQSMTIDEAADRSTAIDGLTVHTENGTPVVSIRLAPNPTVTEEECRWDPATEMMQCRPQQYPAEVDRVSLYREGDENNTFSARTEGQVWEFPLDAVEGSLPLVAAVHFNRGGEPSKVGFSVSIVDESAAVVEESGWYDNA